MNTEKLKSLVTLALLFGLGQACLPYKKSLMRFGSGDVGAKSCEAGESVVDGVCVPDEPPTGDDPPGEPPGPEVVAGPPPTPMPATLPDTFAVSATTLDVSNAAGAKPVKGDTVNLKLTLKNAGKKEGSVKVTPILTSKRFSDYSNVRLATQDIKVLGGETKIATIAIEPFFSDTATKKEYALNRGAYSIAFEFEPAGGMKSTFDKVPNKDFEVGQSNVVFTGVFWEQAYFDKQKYTGGVEKYLAETWTRKGEIMTPTQKNGTTGTFQGFDKGFDEMMKVKTVFKTFEGFSLDTKADFSGSGILHQVEDHAKKVLGLKERFQGRGCDAFTHDDNHGYDMIAGLSENGFGGLAWLCGNALAAGVFDGDPSVGRTQMVLIHEAGHNYGADHCDPIQGFLMCSGEKHEHYTNGGGLFVWHKESLDQMLKKEEQNITMRNTNFSLTGTAASKPSAVPMTCNGFY